MYQQTIILVNRLQASSMFNIKKRMNESRHTYGELHLLYAMPSCPVSYYQLPSMVALYQASYQEAWQRLREVGAFFDVPAARQWFYQGAIPEAVAKVRRSIGQEDQSDNFSSADLLFKLDTLNLQPA